MERDADEDPHAAADKIVERASAGSSSPSTSGSTSSVSPSTAIA
jgi:hypothetical protein